MFKIFAIKNIKPEDMENFFVFLKSENIHISDIHKYLDNLLVCYYEGVLSGFGYGEIVDHSFYLKGVFVTPNNRGMGLGSAIVKAFINKMDLLGMENIYSYGNDIKFFKKLNFSPCESNVYYANVKEYFLNCVCK